MNLLAGTLYDPTGGAAVSKATTALLAMTALDTVNLRLTFTVPLSGKAFVRIVGGALHGAATYPSILVGILNGATVVARVQPTVAVNGAASATTPASVLAEFIVTGLTPGASLTWDLAYGVEQIVALTGWKYGGPNNNTTAGDAFGGISFEVWDPSPIYLPTVMPTLTVAASETAIKAKTDSLTFTTALKVDAAFNAAADFPQAAADKVWSTATRALTDKVGFALSAAGVQAIWDALTSALTTVGSIGKLLVDNVNATISSRSTYAGADTAGTTTLLARITQALLFTAGGNVKADVEEWRAAVPNALTSGKVDAALLIRGGTATAGAAGSITLDAGASATDNLYRGLRITIVSGTGAGQCRLISAYVGATKVASVSPNWTTAPDATSVFIVAAWAAVDVEQVGLTQQTARDLGLQLDATVSSRMATFTLPANFSALSITAGGLVDITQAAADKVWATAARTLTSFGTLAADVWASATRTLTAISDSAGVTTLLGRLTAGRATNLDNLDATISTRSTYAGADTAGTTTLLARVPGVVPVAADYTAGRAARLDHLDADITSVGGGGGSGATVSQVEDIVNPPTRRRVVTAQVTRRL